MTDTEKLQIYTKALREIQGIGEEVKTLNGEFPAKEVVGKLVSWLSRIFVLIENAQREIHQRTDAEKKGAGCGAI